MSSHHLTDQTFLAKGCGLVCTVLVVHLAGMPNSSHFLLITVPGLLHTDPLRDYFISHATSSTARKLFVSEAASPGLAAFSQVYISVA